MMKRIEQGIQIIKEKILRRKPLASEQVQIYANSFNPELRKQSNNFRETTYFTRFMNVDGTFEEIEDSPIEKRGLDYVSDEELFEFLTVEYPRKARESHHLDLANGRLCIRVFAVKGISGRKFHREKLGGNGWSIGLGSLISEVEDPDKGKLYDVDLGGGAVRFYDEPTPI